VSLYLAANVVDSDNNDGQAVFTLGPYDSQADAQATVEEITQLHGGQWVFAGAGFGQYYNAAYIYQLLVSGSGTQWFTQAFINSGVAQSSGFSDGPTLTQYTSESDANNGLAALMQQLSMQVTRSCPPLVPYLPPST